MFTGGQIPVGQTAPTTHVHRRSNPCRPDRTWQVAMSGRSRDTRTQVVIPAGQTPLSWSPCQGGAATHVHRRSNPCRPDCTRQVAVSGRSRDTRLQAVKSLSARPHLAGRRVREEPRHMFTGGQIPAGQTAPTTHVHRRSNPCRPDHTWQVAMSGRSRDTRTKAVIPAGQTALGRSPFQGGAATQIHMWPTLLARSLSLKYCKLTSPDASSSEELYITTTTLF